MRTTIPFTKMVAAGNDFLVIDTRRLHRRGLPWKAVSRALCDRHHGIGADGLLVLEPSVRADVRMRVFNPDGSEANMCGNGARCVAQYLKNTSVESGPPRRWKSAGRGKWKVESGKRHVSIETKAGRVTAEVQGDRVAMHMTDPTRLRTDLSLRVNGKTLRAVHLNTGVPHTVVPVTRLDRLAVNDLGRALRSHRAFSPHGTNVDFIQPLARSRLRVRTYERGVEAETLACGTGVAASAVAYVLGDGSRGRPFDSGPGLPRLRSGQVGRGALAQDVASPEAKGRPERASFDSAQDARPELVEGRAQRVEGRRQWSPGLARGAPRQRHRVNVETRSGDRMAVSFTVSGSGRGVAVTDLVLEGRARRICEGTVQWP